MNLSTVDSGKRGEEFAASYLKRLGFRVIGRNFRIRGGELDIIAIERSKLTGQETLVFVEVKTRTSDEYGTPFEAITYWKLKSLIKTAQFYMLKNPGLPQLMRIDAIAVKIGLHNELLEIELVKNIT
jgi:putative endonuclease